MGVTLYYGDTWRISTQWGSLYLSEVLEDAAGSPEAPRAKVLFRVAASSNSRNRLPSKATALPLPPILFSFFFGDTLFRSF